MRNETLLETFEKLPYKAKLLVIDHNDFNIVEDIDMYINYINSPIEKIFITAFLIYCKAFNKDVFIEPQIEIMCNKKLYIVDFEIKYDEMCNPSLKKDFNLAIECDGYDFHQKTKKQVEYDNKREYDLKMAGYQILRFSGSEIYNNPYECINRLFNYLEEFGYDK